MLTMNPIYGYSKGRAQNSKSSGSSAPKDFAGFFISALKGRECEEYPNNSARLLSCFELPTPYGIREQSSQKGKVDMNNQLVFKSHTLTPVIVNNQPYLETRQIGVALGYTRGDVIGQLYKAHADEFTQDMTCTSDLLVQGQKHKVRVFSLRGCHLLAMFSKTPVAKEFRRWVLDLIEQRNQTISETAPASLDAKTLGGVVKRCTAAAVREEVGNAFAEHVKSMFADFAIKTFAMGQDLKPFQRVTDDMLLRGLYDWYATKHHDFKQAIDDLTAENDRLKSKMATIRKTAEE